MSPASRLIVGIVLVVPGLSAAGPCAPRKPSAVARMVYSPEGAVRLNVPSALATTEAATELSALSKVIVTGLTASTCPVSVPFMGMGVEVGVGEASGVEVSVGVGDAPGVAVGGAD